VMQVSALRKASGRPLWRRCRQERERLKQATAESALLVRTT
jgi:hypothetical protein